MQNSCLLALIIFVAIAKADDDWLLPWQEATVMLVAGPNPLLEEPGSNIQIGRKANATGFLVQAREELNLPPLLITCKHVPDSLVSSYGAIYIYFFDSETKSIFRDGCIFCPISENTPGYFCIESYDVAAFVIDTCNVIGDDRVLDLIRPFDFSNTRLLDNLNHGDGIALLGYPGSILRSYPWTERPLLRMGSISWIMSNNDPPQEFLVDIETYPGYSGSPIVFIQEYSPNMINPEPVSFAGIQTSAIVYNNSESILSGNTGLATVIPSDIVVLLSRLVFASILENNNE